MNSKSMNNKYLKNKSINEFYMIYSLDGCPYSIDAERILVEHNLPHNIVRVPRDENLKNFYKERHQMSSFPQIFYIQKSPQNTQFSKIGGRDDLVRYLS